VWLLSACRVRIICTPTHAREPLEQTWTLGRWRVFKRSGLRPGAVFTLRNGWKFIDLGHPPRRATDLGWLLGREGSSAG